ncbi:hypothetical protein D3C87_397470 [compost metagenome]
MVLKYKKESYDFEVIFDDYFLKYFNPLAIKEETFKFVPLKKKNSKEQPKTLEEINQEDLEKQKRSRWVNGDFYIATYVDVDGDEEFHPDYDVYEYASQVLFKIGKHEIDKEQTEKVVMFVHNLRLLLLLYKADHWDKRLGLLYTRDSDLTLFEEIEKITYLKQLLDKLENSENSEMILRRKDEYEIVITSESQKIPAEDFKPILLQYAERKYYEFIHRYNAYGYLPLKDISTIRNRISKLPQQEIAQSNSDISFAMNILSAQNINPFFTYYYFSRLESHLNSLIASKKEDPIYEFLKIAAPELNRAIEDNAHPKFKKKDKHLLLFSLLRSSKFLPDRKALELDGIVDVKEDFIKQLLR